MRWWLGAFGLIAGAAVVATVANYGYTTSDTPTGGEITAFLYAVIAIGGIAGPAVSLHLFRLSKLWGLVAGVVALAALLVNLSNSLGAIAGRSDKTLATRTAASDARRETRRELDRVTAERANLHPAGTTQEAVAAAREAVRAAEGRQAGECRDGVGKHCRERGDAVQAAQEALAKVLRDRGEAERADKLDARAKELRTRLDNAPAVAAVNPQATILGRLFKLPDTDAMTGQQVATAVVVELLIALSLIGFELLGRRDAIPAVATSEPTTIEPSNVVQLAPPTGRVGEFMAENAKPVRKSRVEWGDIYLAYLDWCKSKGRRTLAEREFGADLFAFCETAEIDVIRRGGKVYCADVKLAS